MQKFQSLLLLLITIFGVQINFAQGKNEKFVPGGIVNGKATQLPKPVYPKEAKDFCADGKVEVEVLIGEDGKVISAKAISGDELLQNSAVEAAQKAKFGRTADGLPVKGVVVYNFVPERKCIVVGIVNNKAKYLPKPVYPKNCRCQGIIKVRIVVDMSGNVISARIDSGNPLLRISAVEAARKTKFSPILINALPIFVVAFLEYKFYPNGKVST